MACLRGLLVVGVMAGASGCPPSTFVPNDPDAGPNNGGRITLADIGEPCVDDGSGDNPANQCAGGLECVRVPRAARDAALEGRAMTGAETTLGLALPTLEDHLTVYNPDGSDEGYCTLVGTLQAPPPCPAGAIMKGFRSLVAPGGVALACLRPCEASAECSGGRVCDARYFDDLGFDLNRGPQLNGTIGFCVRPCEADYPDCTRTGFAPIDGQGGVELQVLAVDITGGRICATSGVCEDNLSIGTGNDGDPCNSSADCVEGAACFQIDSRRRAPTDGTGYCATRCFVNQETGPNGTCGTSFCQEGMNFGYAQLPAFDPQGIFAEAVPTLEGSPSTRLFNGLCFDGCVEGFACPQTGAICEAIDATAMNAAWNTISMCVPNEIALD